MKIAIDSGPLTSGHSIRGIGTYTSELINSLKKFENKVKGLNIDVFDFSREPKLLFTGYDVVHFTAFNIYKKSLPDKLPPQSVVTIHDMIPLIYPKNYPGGIKGNFNWLKQKKILRTASAIIVNSETTKKDVTRFTNIEPGKIYVTHLAQRSFLKKVSKIGLSKIRKQLNLPSQFALYVGDINFNKNIANLIRASKKIDIPLVICGKSALDISGSIHADYATIKDKIKSLFHIPHPEKSHLKEIIDALSENQKVYRLGYVDNTSLNYIYNLASVYVQPSIYEGFGIPVVEAMSVGTPVLCARTQALVEVADKCARYFDPYSTVDIADKLSLVLHDSSLRSNMIRDGLKKVQEYSWHKTALKTLSVYNCVQK